MRRSISSYFPLYRRVIFTTSVFSFLIITGFSAFNTANMMPPGLCPGGAGVIGGNVFTDYDFNGIDDDGGTGEEGIEVYIYESTGVGNESVLIDQTTSDVNGDYYFNGLTDGVRYRVEFVVPTVSEFLKSSPNGDDSRTSVQYPISPDCSVDFGLACPADFCGEEDKSSILAPCYISGDPLGGGNASDGPGLVAVPYTASGSGQNSEILQIGEVGTMWGLAYQKETKLIYGSSVLKRHAGFGPGGSGAIYVVESPDLGPGSVINTIDLDALGFDTGTDPRILDPLPALKELPSHDTEAFSLVGKMSFGDMEISEDGKDIWIVNLFDKKLYKITVGNPFRQPTAADVSSLQIPDPGCSATGEYRPWAVKFYKGIVYVGIVCDASTSQNASDLHAYIYAHDTKGAPDNWTNVVDFSLDFDRGYTYFLNPQIGKWNPWSDNYQQMLTNGFFQHPQPILSDIEFDVDGSMILGFLDRMSQQGGFTTYAPDPTNFNYYDTFSSGDIMKVCKIGNDFVVEGDAGCTTAGSANGQGRNGGEFYFDDDFPNPPVVLAIHQETALGGVAYRANSGEIASTAFDPLNDVNTGGLIWLDNTTGERNNSYQIYEGSLGFAGKANGLGDLEIGCSAAPIEIGNYVWYDPNMDGIQDPGETPIPGVNVSLFSVNGTELATVQTDANGEYYFNNTVLKASALTADTMLQFNTDYYVVVGLNQYNTTTQMLFDTLMLTVDSTGMGADSNLNDSDAELANGGTPAVFSGYPYTPVMTGSGGCNDHTLDFGFFLGANCVLTITANVTQNEFCTGSSDGIIEITPGAVAAEYSVDGGRTFSTQTTFTGLASGRYVVIAKLIGNSACQAQTVVNITPGRTVAPPTAVVTQNETCDGANNGIITITPDPANPGTFSLNGGAFTTQTVYSGLAPGRYTVTLREDANPVCQAETVLNIAVGPPSPPPTAVVTQNEGCPGARDGIITVTPNMARPSTFSINGGAFSTQTVYSGLAPGRYTIRAREDANPGCESQRILNVSPGTPIAPPSNVTGYEICQFEDVPAGEGLTGDCIIICHPDSVSQLTWWTAATGGTQVGSGSPFDPVTAGAVNNSVAGTTTFFAQCQCGTCVSTRVPADFTVKPVPTPEIVGPDFVCPGELTVFELMDKLGNDVFWTLATGGVIINQNDTAATIQWTTVQGSGPYSVVATETAPNGCSAVAMADVLVNNTSIACNDSIQISLDVTGCAIVTPDQILEGTYNNFDVFTVEIEFAGNVIGNKVDCSHAGQALKVNIRGACDGNSCWSTIVVEDKLPPVINCPDMSDIIILDCTNDVDTIAPPTVSDNCGNAVIRLVNEEITDLNGCEEILIKRTWIATNDQGMESAPCMQFISLIQPDAPTFPDDVTWTCEQYSAFPNIVEGVALHRYILENAAAIDLTSMQCVGPTGDDVPGVAPYEANTQYWLDTEDLDVMLDPNYDDNYDNPNSDFDPACGTLTPEDDSSPEEYNTSILVGCPYISECNITPNAHNPTFIKTPIYDAALPWDGLEDADILAMTGSGTPDWNMGYCKVAITFSDQKSEVCAGVDTAKVFKIFRTWNVFNWCTGERWSDLQIIKVVDKIAPKISVAPILAEANFSTYDGDEAICTSTDLLPPPTMLSDDCSEVFVQIITPIGEAIYTNGFDGTEGGTIPAPGLGFGSHSIQYIATDACGNRSQTTAVLEVTDFAAPTMICREYTDVSLSYDNWARVCGEDLDEGSYDNCGIDSFFIKRMNEPDSLFRACIDLNCADTSFMAIVRAVDRSGNYNQCMVEVEVNDKLRPDCRAPEDVWTTCDSIPRYYDLSDTTQLHKLFGTATYFDNCEAYIEEQTPEVDLDMCGVGTIVRNWIAIDPSGNRSSNRCRQTIMVQGTHDYKITFPADYAGVCGDIENADSVLLENFACDQLAFDVEDLKFNISDDGACYKIIRKWTVLNWCAYDGNSQPIEIRNDPDGVMILSDDYNAHGYYTYKQLIVVKDTLAPVISYDGDTEFCSTNAACDGVVEIDPDVDDGCTNDLEIRWNLDLDCNGTIESQGFNSFSKYVPIGEHCITYIVTDGCGNVGSYTIDFEVNDCKKPTPICHNGLSADLDLDGEIEIWATDFDAGSFDYCTDKSDLKFRANNIEDVDGNGFITPDDYRVVVPGTANIPLTCDDLGIQFVQMWVGDNHDNWDYCVTFVEVQDNMGFCGTGTKMGGKIATTRGKSVSDVKVELSGDHSQSLMTDMDGMFEFGSVALGGDYSVIPVKNEDHANGVSTFDIFQISQHILNVKRLDSPYKVIAADANHSGNVSTLDLVEIRKVILRVQPEFTNNTSWRFVDKNHIFADANNPFAAGFPEVINYNNLALNELNSNFVAIKIGDINGDVQTGNAQNVDGRTGNTPKIVRVENEALQPNEITTVRFDFAEAKDMVGYQFTLEFDPELMELENVIENDFVKESNFGFAFLDEGIITASWNSTNVNSEALFFELVFRASEDIELKEVLKINSRYTRAEAFNAEGELKNIELQFNGIETPEADFTLHQNKPNPFSDGTIIGFDLPDASTATLTVFDLSGKIVKLINKNFPQGYNEIEITKDALNGAGVYYYRLETATDAATRKMMFLE